MGMMKQLSVWILTSALCVGCTSLSPLPTLGKDSYLVDIDQGVMCYFSECFNLALIKPSHQDLPIALAFGLPKKAYSFNQKSLAKLLLSPPNKLYEVKKLSGTQFEIPRNEATELSFRTLKYENYILYDRR